MKETHTDVKRYLKHLKAAHDLLEDCLKAEDIASTLYKISVALTNIRIVVNSIPLIEYPYADILKIEQTHFHNKEVTYMDGITGKVEIISFSDIPSVSNSTIKYIGASHDSTIDPSNYTIWNPAIGLVDVEHKKAFCKSIAIRHSITYTVNRWKNESERMIYYIERM